MKYLFMMALLFLISCQSAYLVKPTELPKLLDDSASLSLEMPDKSSYKLSDIYREHRGIVAVFWQMSCPCVKRYQKRVNDLFARYSVQGLAFIHVSSNDNESFDEVEKEYKNRNIPITLMRDKHGIVAKALKVKGTPTAVLIDSSGKVQFMGWIDNERDIGETGRIAYLEDALRQFLAGQTIVTPTSPMFGCSIR